MKYLTVLILLTLMAIQGIAREYDVGSHELLLMPTAYTMPKGNSYFTDYELFFLNYTYAVTAHTHLGVFTLFPITKDFIESLTLGLKQNYARSSGVEAAVWATFTPKIGGFTIGNVFSFGSERNNYHVGISGATENDSDHWEFIYMLGAQFRASERVSVIAEYTNFSSFVEEDFNGLVTLGVRLRSSKMAWELAGIRPLQSTGDLLFLPLLKATIYF